MDRAGGAVAVRRRDFRPRCVSSGEVKSVAISHLGTGNPRMVSPSGVFAGRPDVGHDRMHPMRPPAG
jgi:hypothetical protein